MTDPRKFKAPFIPKERIWQEADRLRVAHPAGRSLPVQVLDLAEFDLGLDLVPVNGLTTNNRMEIYAAIAGLELLKQPCKVTLYSDSQYLVKAMTEGWVVGWKKKSWWRTRTERPENVDLWQRLDALCQTHQVEFRWVKGHAGNLENERCDQLAMAALRQPNLPVDDGYESKPETEGVRPDMQEGEPCGKCGTPVIKRKGKWKPGRDYYYEFHLLCPKCQTTYHVESARRLVEQPPSLF
ncbi:MAG TPA: RNase H family protein [Candidatus Binatia bacterium]|nr:RNase H family protein [Candidatus Binatia bacterium]